MAGWTTFILSKTDFYKNMLGITEWQAGLPLYYQKLPEEVKDLPTEQSPELIEALKQYS